ncbi:hypothetical protein LSTR_LSTR004528 [Laodelphax striatellus]|uniref:Chorein N-terminal domain-containing protein n=1 Tax=Laodelphax striatellus TaxID=195883 RepID=A0A482WUY5_LAOST|nr:hypothetical protein LSTR_LSTR004528 [Laodelphax striatellus]
MYRIESIVTSIILSYVDRYIKNFRRQDAQVSLWQGDGVFHNLDLDLEVLEQELNLPFSFVSGHINELLIHVPWTRIASEPVQITINTIECVMKLCPPGGRPAPPPERFRRQQSQPPDEQTPQSQSYKSSLVNKLICNLSITCNNFILKYVEEDIVLSMNIKNLSLSSVNEKWEPEITELSASSLILRKLISLSDVTICLDKRNASGRIESYMEPLLYRCFLTIRLSRLYASPTATKAMSTRMDVFCEKMAFTLSESQVPMLMRMFALALALHRKQLTPQMSQTSMADSNSETSADEHGADNNGGDDSWSTWFCNVSIDLRGCLMELESHDSDWTNMQAGVSQITIEPSGDCCCGTSEQNQVPYLTAGSHQDSFLSGSLFGSTGTKVTERSWDYHLATVTETTLLEKTPAFAMDYLFSIEKQPYLEEDDEDYEERNKNPLERVLLRYVADHITVRVCSGVIHRTQMIMKAASTYDYSPYSTHYTTLTTVNETSSETEPPNLDDVKLVIPQHMTRFTLFHPTFEIYPANHSPVQPSALGRKLSRSKSRTHIPPVGLPTVCLVIKWDCLDAKLTRPLTPDKVKLLSAFKPTELTTEILNDSDTRFSFKAVGISSFLKMDSTETAAVINVLELNKLSIDRAIHNLACRTKSDVSTEIQVHIENFLLSFSKPKLLLTIEIINSLIMSNNRSRYQVSYNSLFNTSLVQDAAIVSDIVFLKLAMDKLTLKQVLTGMSESIQVCVNSCQGFAVQLTDRGQHKQTMILDAPNTNINTPLLTGIFQRPIEDSQHAPVLMFSLHGVRLSADPLIYSWLLYVPIQFPSAKTFHHPQFVSQTSVLTTTGSSSKGRRVSDGSLGSMMKRAPTPQESIHSSETRSAQLSSQQLVTESVVETTQPTLSEKITNLFPIWQTVVVSVDIADLSVYFPNNTLSSTLPQPMETDLQNALQSLSPPLHVAIFKVPSVTLRCASLKQSLVETRLPVIFPTAIWSPERSNFPWSLNISDLQCFTVHGGTQLQLLKPFSATCTVGVSTK